MKNSPSSRSQSALLGGIRGPVNLYSGSLAGDNFGDRLDYFQK